MATATYTSKDQHWQDEKTTYWFEVDGHDNGTGASFENQVFGIAESGRYVQKLSQFQPDGTFVEDGICPFESGLDTFDYNYKSPHDDVMLSPLQFVGLQ